MFEFGLVMIVKDEEHIVEETLTSIYENINIDCAFISDTGSSDKTVEVMSNFFESKNIYYEIFHDEWKGFDHNRSLVLEHARNKSKYCIMFDADDLCKNKLNFPKHADKSSYSVLLTDESESSEYFRKCIFKNDDIHMWKYIHPVHEFPVCSDKIAESTQMLSSDFRIISRRKGNRSKNPLKYLNDARCLKNHLKINWNNRDMFYAGNSYKDHALILNDINYLKKAIYWYDQRLLNEGLNNVYYKDEIVLSLFNKASIYEKFYELGYEKNINNVIKLYEEVYNTENFYIESYYRISILLYKKKKYELAYKYASKVVDTPIPKNFTLFFNKRVYTFYIYEITSLILYKLYKLKNIDQYLYLSLKYLYQIYDQWNPELHHKFLGKIEKQYNLIKNKKICVLKIGTDFNNDIVYMISTYLSNKYNVYICTNNNIPIFNYKNINENEYQKIQNIVELVVYIDNIDLNINKNKNNVLILHNGFKFNLKNGLVACLYQPNLLNMICKNINLIFSMNDDFEKWNSNILSFEKNKYLLFDNKFDKLEYKFVKTTKYDPFYNGVEFVLPHKTEFKFFIEHEKDIEIPEFYIEKFISNTSDISNIDDCIKKIQKFDNSYKTSDLNKIIEFMRIKKLLLTNKNKSAFENLKSLLKKDNLYEIDSEIITQIIEECYEKNKDYYTKKIEKIEYSPLSDITVVLDINSGDIYLLKNVLFSFLNSISPMKINSIKILNNKYDPSFLQQYKIKEFDIINTTYVVYLNESIFYSAENFLQKGIDTLESDELYIQYQFNKGSKGFQWEPSLIKYSLIKNYITNPFKLEKNEIEKLLSYKEYKVIKYNGKTHYKLYIDKNIQNKNKIEIHVLCNTKNLSKLILDGFNTLNLKLEYHYLDKIKLTIKKMNKHFYKNKFYYDYYIMKKLVTIFKIFEESDSEYLLITNVESNLNFRECKKLIESIDSKDFQFSNLELTSDITDQYCDSFIIRKDLYKFLYQNTKKKYEYDILGLISYYDVNQYYHDIRISNKINKKYEKIENYVYITALDCYGYDYKNVPIDISFKEMAYICDENNESVAFNTNGYYKKKIPSLYNLTFISNLKEESFGDQQGIYIKKDYWDKLIKS